MKILQITFGLSPGGAERFVVDLSNELVKHHEVVLLTLMDDQDNPEKAQFYRFDLNNKVKYKNLGIKKGGGFSVKVLWRVYQAMKNEKADVIHLHVHGVVNFCIIGIMLLCCKTTIVQTIHTDFKIGHSSLLYKFLFKTVGRVHKMRWVALSQSNYNDMIASYPYLFATRIDNGRAPMTPTSLFEKTKEEVSGYKMSSKTKVFLHVARCVEVKNQRLLVSAFNNFVNEGKDAILLVIGADFDSDEGVAIQKIAGNHIHFLGTKKNIADYMLNADCFCLSSTYEGLPITILEALLSGVPVVSTPVKGALDVLKNCETGIISKDFSKECYVEALNKAMEGMSELQAKTMAAKNESPYTIRECAKKYEEFYLSKDNRRRKRCDKRHS